MPWPSIDWLSCMRLLLLIVLKTQTARVNEVRQIQGRFFHSVYPDCSWRDMASLPNRQKAMPTEPNNDFQNATKLDSESLFQTNTHVHAWGKDYLCRMRTKEMHNCRCTPEWYVCSTTCTKLSKVKVASRDTTAFYIAWGWIHKVNKRFAELRSSTRSWDPTYIQISRHSLNDRLLRQIGTPYGIDCRLVRRSRRLSTLTVLENRAVALRILVVRLHGAAA